MIFFLHIKLEKESYVQLEAAIEKEAFNLVGLDFSSTMDIKNNSSK